ncbi:AAWKG family protein [Streptomyces sp. NPDC026673]|uniref:AAWKG family protein n=1 Tax=Streptomyces sp. NPDC026673 TaxID=3155724 RepID=UPI0033F6114B
MPLTAEADDYWGIAVNLFTGFPMPARGNLFGDSEGLNDSPVIASVDVQKQRNSVTPLTEDAFSYLVNDTSDMDYRFAFYAGSPTDLGAFHATVRFIFRLSLDPENPWTSWSGNPGNLPNWISGGDAALRYLWRYGHSRDFAYNGTGVADADVVDFGSFDRTARAFDRTKQFFADHEQELKCWADMFASDGASWTGSAAGIFNNIVTNLQKRYGDATDDLGGADFSGGNVSTEGYTSTSNYGDALIGAQSDLRLAVSDMLHAWTAWSQGNQNDPMHWVTRELNDFSGWLLRNNTNAVLAHMQTQGNHAGPQLDKNRVLAGPSFQSSYGGRPITPENFPNIVVEVANAGMTRWNEWTNSTIVAKSQEILGALRNSWLDRLDAAPTPQGFASFSASQDFATTSLNEHNSDAMNAQNEFLEGLGKNQNEFFESLNDGLGGANTESLLDNLNELGADNDLANAGTGGDGNTAGSGGNTDSLLNDLNELGADNDLANAGTGGDGNTAGPGGNTESPLNNLPDLGLGDPAGAGTGTDGNTASPVAPLPLNNLPIGTPPASSLPKPPTNLPGLPGSGDEGEIFPLPNAPELNDDGSLTIPYPDGSEGTFNPHNGNLTVVDHNGNSSTHHLDPGDTFTNPDGSTTHLNNDGTLTTEFPDGSSQTFDPSDGSLHVTDPEGNSHDLDLDPAHGVPTGSPANPLPDSANSPAGLPGAGHSSPLNQLPTHTASPGATWGEEFLDYDDSPFSNTGLGEPGTGTGVGGISRGTPLNSLPMMPASMSSPGQGGGGFDERVRNSPDALVSRRPGVSMPSVEEDMSIRNRPATSSTAAQAPMYPPPMGGGGQPQQTESGDRTRESWIAESEDVWGTEQGGAPTVIA